MMAWCFVNFQFWGSFTVAGASCPSQPQLEATVLTTLSLTLDAALDRSQLNAKSGKLNVKRRRCYAQGVSIIHHDRREPTSIIGPCLRHWGGVDRHEL